MILNFKALKRFIDITFSGLGLLILSPFLLLIMVLIAVESKGGVFYVQERIGLNKIPFRLYKFRSMNPNADKAGLLTVGSRDHRITRIGYFIRKFKIDELPQLFNVLKGEMSLVGPRPEVSKYVALYNEHQLKVLSVKPGITDWASLRYFEESDLLAKSTDPDKTYIEEIMPAKLNINLAYIQQHNLKEDFKIIFLTMKKMVVK
jgi:lipopolysaccharide/colanic/teichoic acid biosynthesis glycosyltransferase